VTVALAAGAQRTAADAFVAAARRTAVEPLAVTVVAAAERAAAGLAEAEETLAYACAGTTCAAPAAHPAQLAESLRRLVAQAPAQLVW
jgi:uncharacterized protein YyaL (SSP411 family)